MAMKLFVGLGNPGSKYAKNRHNVGFMAVERIAERHGFGPWKKKFQGIAADGDLGGERILLLKPDTYMNESGRAVGEAARFLKIGLDDIYVFHDELDLAPQKVKVKAGGGNAGHNGLRSITAHLGNDYKRVRLGIGHPGSKDVVIHHVLGDFAKADAEWLDEMLDAVSAAAGRLANGDDSRFLTDVAKALGTMESGKNDKPAASPRAPDKPVKGAPVEQLPRSPGQGRHPAGDRAAKQKSALAENLKKWLAGRAANDTKDGD
jgi:peptidyl-tRNA hydrolase, PTH1 family